MHGKRKSYYINGQLMQEVYIGQVMRRITIACTIKGAE